MTDRPINMRGPEVRALLDGRKTQTRRVLRDQPGAVYRFAMFDGFLGWSAYIGHPTDQSRFGLDVPYAPGDRLWVREAFYRCDACAYLNHAEGANSAGTGSRKCCASCDELLPKAKRSPIHMPRWASRLTLTVTEVRVQRLQEISEEDARAEGIEPIRHEWWQGFVRRSDGTRGVMETCSADGPPPDDFEHPEKQHYERSAVQGFRGLWSSLHGPDAWDANPWVAAITFTVHRGIIDQVPQ